MRVLGVDYGSARVGLALGDTETRIAAPWSVVSRKDDQQIIGAVLELMQKEGIDLVVVGLPRPLANQNRETDQARVILSFIDRLRAKGVNVQEENETWSSSLAAKQGIEAGSHGKRDDLAAANILQGYLDRAIPTV